MKKILLIGNTPSSDPRSIGGATTYTYEILQELKQQNEIELTFLNVRSRWYKGGQLIDFLLLLYKVPNKIFNNDIISIHASWDFHVIAGPILVLISKFFKKKIVYHFFGGNFHKRYEKFPKPLKWWLYTTILKSNFKLMETKRMIQFFEDRNHKNIIWFPNTRKPAKNDFINAPFSKKFVFISRITPSKGVDYFLDVSKDIDESYTMDIYGPIDTTTYDKVQFKRHHDSYKGILKPTDVIQTLSKYDVLVLPTFYEGEGYPGIFIEAMSLGKPIICTKWNALDELVVDDYNGKLIPVKSSAELRSAIEFFNSENYAFYSKNAFQQFDDYFNINNTTKQLLELYLN